jgi:hypothetical protein
MSYNVLQAPRELFIQALNRDLNIQCYKVLYICGNYSSILSRLDCRFQELEIRRVLTVFQLMTRVFKSIIVKHIDNFLQPSHLAVLGDMELQTQS